MSRNCSWSGASSGCWQPHWGRCFYCCCVHTPASPHQGPETVRYLWKLKPQPVEMKHLLNLLYSQEGDIRACSVWEAGRPSYRLEGNVFWWAKFDTFIYKSVEVALSNVGWNFSPKLSGDDGALHWTTLQESKQKAMEIFRKVSSSMKWGFCGLCIPSWWVCVPLSSAWQWM